MPTVTELVIELMNGMWVTRATTMMQCRATPFGEAGCLTLQSLTDFVVCLAVWLMVKPFFRWGPAPVRVVAFFGVLFAVTAALVRTPAGRVAVFDSFADAHPYVLAIAAARTDDKRALLAAYGGLCALRPAIAALAAWLKPSPLAAWCALGVVTAEVLGLAAGPVDAVLGAYLRAPTALAAYAVGAPTGDGAGARDVPLVAALALLAIWVAFGAAVDAALDDSGITRSDIQAFTAYLEGDDD